MDDQDKKAHFFDKPKNVKRTMRVFFVCCVILLLLDVVDAALQLFGIGDLRHSERPWEGWPGFHAIYGFVACVLLVLVAKEMRKILMRREDYYDR